MSTCPECRHVIPAEDHHIGLIWCCPNCGVASKYTGHLRFRPYATRELRRLRSDLRKSIAEAQRTAVLPPPQWALA